MLTVFISHSHEEKDLALAWQTLLEHVSQGAIEVWLSSDTKPTGGMKIGAEWRENIYIKLEMANFVLAIISPRTVDRPWILWECGAASGTNKERGLIPVIFSMPLSDFDGPLSSYQAYAGEDKDKVIEICERLLVEAKLSPKKQYWEPILDTYLGSVRLHRPPRNAGPAAVSLWVRRIETYLISGRTSELPALADSMYSSLGSSFTIDVQIHELLSQVYLETGSYDLALAEVNRAIDCLPEDLGLLHRKILILIEKKEYFMARDNLDFIYREFPEAKFLPEIAGVEGRLHRELYESTGDKQELETAINAYELAYQRDPLSYYCGVNAVNLKLLAGKIEEAQKLAKEVMVICKDLLKHERSSFWLYFTLGELYLVLGDYENALKSYSDGLGRDPIPQKRQIESAFKGVRRVFASANLDSNQLARFDIMLGLKD